MRIWVSDKEARAIRRWAIAQGDADLADRFHRGALAEQRMPWLWRRRRRRPHLLQCAYCQQWDSFGKHGWAKRDWTQDPFGFWVHKECAEAWDRERMEILKERGKEENRRRAEEFLLGNPDRVALYAGVLVRVSEPHENNPFGLFDDLDMEISADSGNQKVTALIDDLTEEERSHLVAAGFLGYSHGYHVVLGWADLIPSDYADEEELEDVKIESIIVDQVPRHLREQLPT